MFRFESFHMYGIIGTAVVIGAIIVALIKRTQGKTLAGDSIAFRPKQPSIVRYLFGGTIFGLGWAMTGACPGPMFTLLGHGIWTMGLVIGSAILGTYVYGRLRPAIRTSSNMKLAGAEAPTLTIDGQSFRDLNKNGQLDVYEDVNADVEARVEDLLAQMNLEEKAGMLFAHFLGMNKDGSLLEVPTFSDPFSFLTESTSTTLLKKKMTQVQNLGGTSALVYAQWNNNL